VAIGVIGLALGPVEAAAGDHFIILGTERSQEAAQQVAAMSEAWVLDTDLYPKLPPNLFAVVRGPYVTSAEARAELAFLQTGGEYEEAQVKDAGACRLPPNLGGAKLPAAVFTALMGELSVEVTDKPGSTNPCEPQEPYQRVEIRLMRLELAGEGADPSRIRAVPQTLPVDGFFVIKRTGEIQRLRICME
jgi:hypothetical protein